MSCYVYIFNRSCNDDWRCRLREYIKSFLFLVLALTLLKNLSPSKSYDKYIKLFISILFVTSVISPILNLIKGEDYADILGKNISIINNKADSFMLNKMQSDGNNLILEEYKGRITDNIKSNLKKKFNKEFNISLDINEDSNSENYAQINGVYLSYDSELKGNVKAMIKKYIADSYSVDEDNIYIKAGKN